MKRIGWMIAVAALAAGTAWAQGGRGKAEGRAEKTPDAAVGGCPCCQLHKRGGSDRFGCPMGQMMRKHMRGERGAGRGGWRNSDRGGKGSRQGEYRKPARGNACPGQGECRPAKRGGRGHGTTVGKDRKPVPDAEE